MRTFKIGYKGKTYKVNAKDEKTAIKAVVRKIRDKEVLVVYPHKYLKNIAVIKEDANKFIVAPFYDENTGHYENSEEYNDETDARTRALNLSQGIERLEDKKPIKDELSQKEREAIWKENEEKGWGFTGEEVVDFIQEHKIARQNNNINTMERIEYQLEDCNYHTLVKLLNEGDYDGAYSWYRKEYSVNDRKARDRKVKDDGFWRVVSFSASDNEHYREGKRQLDLDTLEEAKQKAKDWLQERGGLIHIIQPDGNLYKMYTSKDIINNELVDKNGVKDKKRVMDSWASDIVNEIKNTYPQVDFTQYFSNRNGVGHLKLYFENAPHQNEFNQVSDNEWKRFLRHLMEKYTGKIDKLGVSNSYLDVYHTATTMDKNTTRKAKDSGMNKWLFFFEDGGAKAFYADDLDDAIREFKAQTLQRTISNANDIRKIVCNGEEVSFDKEEVFRKLQDRKARDRKLKDSLVRYADTDAQEETLKILEEAMEESGVKLYFGTKVGKYPQSIILDYHYQDNIGRVYSNGALKIDGNEFGSWEDDYVDLSSDMYEIVEVLKSLS